VSRLSISQYLPLDVAEDDVDTIGRSVLNEHARGRGLRITGDVERVYDAFVVGVRVPDADDNMSVKHVPIDSPLAEGRSPDARMVTWEVETEPTTADPAPRLTGTIGNDGITRAVLPAEIVEHGGMVAFVHNLGSDDVLITAYAADGSTVGYEYAIEISGNEHQVLLPPGVSHLQAVIDTEEDAR
jgi:hypothetical protein